MSIYWTFTKIFNFHHLLFQLLSFKRQSHKMVKHTQTIRRQFAITLCKSIDWFLYKGNTGAYGLNVIFIYQIPIESIPMDKGRKLNIYVVYFQVKH